MPNATHVTTASIVTTKAVTIPGKQVQHPAVTDYSQDFESFATPTSNPDGWTPAGTVLPVLSASAYGSVLAHSGVSSMGLTTTANGIHSATRTVTGMTVGMVYTLSAWYFAAKPTTAVTVGPSGSATPTAPVTGSWIQATNTFTATATSAIFLLQVTTPSGTSGAIGYFDDIQLVQNTWTETIAAVTIPAGTTHNLDVVDGSYGLTEAGTPYASASITVSYPGPDIVRLMDPDDRPRLSLSAYQVEFTPSWFFTRPFNLLITDTDQDEQAGTLTITAGSDDSLLNSFKLMAAAPDSTCIGLQSSVRSIVNYVIGKVSPGASLVAGPDAAFTIMETTQNLVLNPSFEASLANASVYGGPASVTTTRLGPYGPGNGVPSGSYFMRGTYTTAGGGGGPRVTSITNISGNTTYTAYGFVRSRDQVQMNCIIEWFDAAGHGIYASYGDTATLLPSTWTQLAITVQSPPGAVSAAVDFYAYGAPFVTGSTVDLDAVFMGATDIVTPYFDGDSVDNALFNFAWDGAASASSSTRTAIVERLHETLVWQPGQLAWDFLDPILTAVGLTLWCDETKTWQLTSLDYNPTGTVTLADGVNLTNAGVGLSNSATDASGKLLRFDACTVTYSWTDSNGIDQTKADVYAPAGWTTSETYEFDSAYPGPGAAAYYVTKHQNAGHQFDLTALIDFTVTPSQSALVQVTGLDPEEGFVQSVSWDIGSDEMTVATRGLIKIMGGSYAAQLSSTYASISQSAKYSDYPS